MDVFQVLDGQPVGDISEPLAQCKLDPLHATCEPQ